jgi:hypothetical protein
MRDVTRYHHAKTGFVVGGKFPVPLHVKQTSIQVGSYFDGWTPSPSQRAQFPALTTGVRPLPAPHADQASTRHRTRA